MDKTKFKKIMKEILSWVELFALAFVVAFAVNHLLIVNANVPSGSMESTIEPGDRLVGWRLAYINHEPERGDIIMFHYPVDEDEIYIKRVIGLSGETLEIRKGKVYIDGSALEENYLKDEWLIANDGLAFQIPKGYYFVMGDNRNNSLDGRYWAQEAVQAGLCGTPTEAIKEKYCFVSRHKILGKAIFRYYPSVKKLNEKPYS